MSNSDALEPWRIAATSFPGHDAPPEARLRFMIGYAILAPSGHNAQPWLFRIAGDHLELLADRTRALPVVDPHDRALTIACGSALFNLRVAARHFGYQVGVELLPDPARHDLLARVALGERKTSNHAENTLFVAIPNRRTSRVPFERTTVDKKVIERLEAGAAAEGAWFRVVKERHDRHTVADLIADGDRMQFADKRFRRELASWLHSNRSHTHDGMPGYALGHGDLVSMIEPLVIRTFDVGKGVGAKDRDLAEHSPVLAVISTSGDGPADWLRAGQALEHVLLEATAAGLTASFLNQPIEVETLRPRLAKLVERAGDASLGFPQVLLRMGRAPEVKPMPRRAVSEVVRN
ncbi:MAG: Acg family FMN-binding oxidoreductase [Phycisphaerales bacterium]